MFKIFLAMMTLQIGALIIPGPDFAIVLRHSIIKGKRDGFLCAAGLAVGVIINVFITYLIGSKLYSNYRILYLIFIGCGLLYLFYISFSLIHNFFLYKNDVQDITISQLNKNNSNSFIVGLLTHISNVKAIVFFSALLPLVKHLNVPFMILAWVGMGPSTLLWFSLVVILFGNNKIRHSFLAEIHIVELVIGCTIFIFASAIFYEEIYKYFIS